MSRILITGAGGMVGSHMSEILSNDGHDILGTFYKPTVDINEIKSKINLTECDVRYFQGIFNIIKNFKPEIVFHLAAQSYPSVSWDKPQETMDTNINGTINLFESIKFLKNIDEKYDPVIIVACSSAEYGKSLDELENKYADENTPLKPLHPYGISKVGQDLLTYQYYINYNIKGIRARIFNTTGVRKVNDVTSDFTKRAVEIEKGIIKNNVLRVGNIETERAIMDVKDLVSALILLSQKGKAGEAYNVSSENIYKIKDIIFLIEKEMNTKFELFIDKNLLRPTDEKIIVGDVTKLKNDTGWYQNIELSQTIHEMVEYWRKKLG